MNRQHPAERWRTAARLIKKGGVDNLTRLRLAAMAGNMRHDVVTARRAALIDLLADGRPHPREEIWRVIEAQLERGCWGKRPEEALWRDLRTLRAGGVRIGYSRRPGVEGYYLQYPPIERQPPSFQESINLLHITGIRQMSVVEKNRQAFAAAAFALRQKRLLVALEHPEWDDAQVDAAARRLVYGRHEIE